MAKKTERMSRADQARFNKRRELMNKAKKVCKYLGISSYTETGNEIYQKAYKMSESKTMSAMVATLQSDPHIELARDENRPEPYTHNLKDEFLGDSSVASLRLENEARWKAAVKGVTDAPLKGLSFGIDPKLSRNRPKKLKEKRQCLPQWLRLWLRLPFLSQPPRLSRSMNFQVQHCPAVNHRLRQQSLLMDYRISSAPGAPKA